MQGLVCICLQFRSVLEAVGATLRCLVLPACQALVANVHRLGLTNVVVSGSEQFKMRGPTLPDIWLCAVRSRPPPPPPPLGIPPPWSTGSTVSRKPTLNPKH